MAWTRQLERNASIGAVRSRYGHPLLLLLYHNVLYCVTLIELSCIIRGCSVANVFYRIIAFNQYLPLQDCNASLRTPMLPPPNTVRKESVPIPPLLTLLKGRSFPSRPRLTKLLTFGIHSDCFVFKITI